MLRGVAVVGLDDVAENEGGAAVRARELEHALEPSPAFVGENREQREERNSASITDETVQSTTNWPARATSSNAGPACRGSTWAIANTATGPIANQALVAWIISLLGRTRPRITSGSCASRNETVTAIGTSATGSANSSGTNAS